MAVYGTPLQFIEDFWLGIRRGYSPLSLYSTATQNVWVWALHLSRPPMPRFRVGNSNMLVSKNAKICVIPDANQKFALASTQNPKASQWNI